MGAPKGNQYAKGHGYGRTKEWTPERIAILADELRDWISFESDTTSDRNYIGDFAKKQGIHRQRFSEWVKSNKDFADAMEFAKQWQEAKFIKNGLTRGWDSSFTQYAMARVCGEEWKKSWDQPEDKGEATPSTIIINKIEK